MMIPTRTTSAWREPMVWLMIGLPLAAVLASVSLVVTAVRTDNNDSVLDNVQRTAQIQTVELGPDARAQALALSAVLRVGGGGLDVLPVAGNFDRNAPLELVLAHPTEAARDRRLRLQPTELGWHAATAPAIDHDWLLDIAPTNHAWRLRGRLRSGEHAAYLAPALGVAVDPGG